MNSEEPKKEDIKTIADFPKFISTSIADQIKQADTKAVGVLGILGIVTGGLLSRLNSIKNVSGIEDPKWIFILGFSVVMILLCMKAIVLVVYPRLSKKGSENMTYFQDIAGFSQEEYVNRGKALTTDEIITNTYITAHNLANIATKKYKALREAMILTIVTIIWTIGVLLLS